MNQYTIEHIGITPILEDFDYLHPVMRIDFVGPMRVLFMGTISEKKNKKKNWIKKQ
jgi:hypothetical protein